MFLIDSESEQEGGLLRSGRRFRSRKTKMTMTRRGSCSTTRVEDYELMSHFDEGSCDEEEEYQPISEREEEALDPKYKYGTPTTLRTSLDVRSRNSSPNGFVNQSNNSGGNN